MQTSKNLNARILRLPEVKHLTGKSRSTIYANMRSGVFPLPLHTGVRSVGWLESEIQNWIASRIAASRPNHKEHLS